MTVDTFAGTRNGATHPPRAPLPAPPQSRGTQPTIVDRMFLAHVAPETLVNTADAAAILNVGAVCVRRLIDEGVLKPVEDTTPYVLMLVDVLAYRLRRKRRRKGGAS